MQNNQVNEYLKKYSYRVVWSEEDGVYIAHAIEVPSILAHASSAEDAIKEVKVPLEIALEAMIESGEEVPEPIATHKFKGKFLVRTTPEQHKELALRAAESGVSMNQYILTKLG